MLLFCGNAIQKGIDMRANSIASPIKTMTKSINQATNRSVHLANTIASVLVVCVIVVVLLLSSATIMPPAIKIIIPTIIIVSAIIPLNEFRLT
jgi:hypothetical protein